MGLETRKCLWRFTRGFAQRKMRRRTGRREREPGYAARQTAALPRFWRGTDDDLEILPQPHEKTHQPFRGKIRESAAQDVRDFGLIDAHKRRSVALRDPAPRDRARNHERELRIRESFVRT